MSLNSKQWMKRLLLTSLIVVVLPVSGVIGFNYYIDPLWNFEHKNEYNDYQLGFDERQQKTNYINSRESFDYDSLLIGTSRVTYMDENEFDTEKVFNYSLSSLHIDEYLPYIKYATEKNGDEFDTIYMELYINSYDGNVVNTNQTPSNYINKAEDPFYRFTSLFSYSTLKSSIDNFKASKDNFYNGPRSYNRENVAQTTYPNDRLPALWERFESSFESSATKPYVYNEDYKNKLVELKETYPNTRFVIFTDLMPVKRLELILSNQEHRKAYERWYKDMVDVFGTIYSFQSVNATTTDLNNFFDWFHYYPSVGSKMINALEKPKENRDFITVVNKDNLEKYLNNLTR